MSGLTAKKNTTMTSIAISGGLAGTELPCGYPVPENTFSTRGLFAGVFMCGACGLRIRGRVGYEQWW